MVQPQRINLCTSITMKLTADILQELSTYAQLNYEDDWYLIEKINELKNKIYKNE